MQGDTHNTRPPSSSWNKEWEVGNTGVFFGNWGTRATVSNGHVKKLRQQIHDKQILKAPGNVVGLCEATESVKLMMEEPPNEDEIPTHRSGGTSLDKRPNKAYWVVRGDEEKALLIASRKDSTTGVECLYHEKHEDHRYRDNRQDKMAHTRTMAAKIAFKQNIGHIGLFLPVLLTHLNIRTAKCEWPQVLVTYWDRLAALIYKYGCHFLLGDFNMSLTEVVPQLRSRGILVDCAAWYPWRHASEGLHGQHLAFDSTAIFYIGGAVQVKLEWGLAHLDILTAAVAEQVPSTLHVYGGFNLSLIHI